MDIDERKEEREKFQSENLLSIIRKEFILMYTPFLKGKRKTDLILFLRFVKKE